MRIVVDLDGTISPLKTKDESYADLIPYPGAIEGLRSLKESGHYIIIQTARNMATQESNLGKVVKNIGKITLDWLEKYGVVYDEIYFGKPNGHVYLDDRAMRFTSWNEIDENVLENIAREK